MDTKAINIIIDTQIKRYIQALRNNNITIWRVYLFGSHAKGTAQPESDIDLAVFLDRNEIDAFDEDVNLLQLTRDIDLRIEPHSFSKRDFENPDPFVNEILSTGERIV